MTQIYLVSVGSYSDYHVEGLFSNEEEAKWFAEKIGGQIEKFELDAQREHPIVTDVNMFYDGTVNHVSHESTLLDNEPLRHGFQSYMDTFDLNFDHKAVHKPTNQWSFCWRVLTDDKERAVKVVAEKRAQLIALGLWGDNEKTVEWAKLNKEYCFGEALKEIGGETV